jgi:glucose/arabinose dehydrogenase
MSRSPRSGFVIATCAALLAAACGHTSKTTTDVNGCDASIKLPPRFCAVVFTDSGGPLRHLVVRKNGDVIAGVLDQRRQPGGIVAMRDTNKDGRADVLVRFDSGGAVHGLVLAGDSTLYASTAHEILRFHWTDSSLVPSKRVDTIVTGLPARAIPSHSLALDTRNNIVVNIGAISNACQTNEAPGAPGRNPCPELETSGGIWSFRLDKTHQTMKDGTRATTGLHNAVALAVSPTDGMIYAVSHDRDELHARWPALYSDEESATIPAEEMIRVATPRADFGWPYCYYDYLKGQRALAPEYGGDKQQVGRCARLIQPLIVFPAHWSPMSLMFYTGKMFPAAYRGGAFIAFHGSSTRAPLPDEGFQVVFLTFKDGLAADYTIFATGFAGGATSASAASHRPVGMALGADGSLYVSDDKGGYVWRVRYK